MKKYKYAFIALVAIFSLAVIARVASANGSYFISPVRTAAATSTLSVVGPGNGTTTLTYDSLALGSTYATDRASLLIQATASSSSSLLGIAVQYSQDGVDWYDNDLAATTSPGSVTNISSANSYQLSGNSTASTSLKAISVPTPTRFVRAVFTSTVATSSIWAQFVPIRQVTQ